MEQDLTQGRLGTQILKFSVPLMLTNVLQVLFNMADVAVVGRFAGSYALGSVGSTTTLVTLFTGFLMGMASGINVLVARFYGARNKKDISQAVHTAALISFGIGILIMLIGLFFSEGILTILHTRPELIDGAVLYLRIYFLGMPGLALYNYGNAVFSAVGNTKKPLHYLTIAGVVNVVLNLFFVVVCKLSVAGVALASMISQFLCAGLIIRALFCSQEVYALHFHDLKWNGAKASMILKVSMPTGLQHAIFQIANLFTQVGVNTFDATMVAGNSAAANADGLVFDVMAAFYTACGSFIGQNYGAGKKERILKSFLISLAYSFGIGLVMGWLLVAFGPQFLSLFTKEPEVITAGMKRLTIMGATYAVSAFMDCTIAASRGLGRTVVPTGIVIMGSCIFRVVWFYTVFAYFGTITSLYMLYIFSWVITAAAEGIYFRKVYRETNLVL